MLIVNYSLLIYIPGHRQNHSLTEIGKIDAEWTNEAEAVYRYCESARLFIAKRTKKEKPIGFSTANYLQPLSHCVTAPLTQGSRFLRDYYLLFLFAVGAIFTFPNIFWFVVRVPFPVLIPTLRKNDYTQYKNKVNL